MEPAPSVLAPPAGRNPPASDRPADAHRPLRAVAVAATSVTFLVIGVGGLVRATGSGDACPDWPRCFGRWIPPLEQHVLIEYSHRVMATLAIVAVGLLLAVSWRRYRRIPGVFRPAAAAAMLIVLQAALGGVVVLRRLEALDVSAHLGTALLLVAALVHVTVRAFSLERPTSERASRLTWHGRGVAAAAFAVILVGATVRAEGAGLAFPDWPLMDGRALPDLSSGIAVLQFAHRVLAGALVVLAVWLAARSRRAPAAPAVPVLASIAAALAAAQVVVGAMTVWSRLSAPAVVAHVVLASLVWGSLVAVASASRLEPDRSGVPAAPVEAAA